MRHKLPANNAANESFSLFTAALVISLFGILTVIEATGAIMISTLFVLAAVAGIGGFVARQVNKN